MSNQKTNNTFGKSINDVVKESNTVENKNDTNIQDSQLNQVRKDSEDQIKLKKQRELQKKEFEENLKFNLYKSQRVPNIWEREEAMDNATFFKLMGCLFLGAAALALLFWYVTSSYKYGSAAEYIDITLLKHTKEELKKCPSLLEEFLKLDCKNTYSPKCESLVDKVRNCEQLAERLKELQEDIAYLKKKK